MTITRDEVLRRARTGWGGLGTVPYSQSTIHQPDGYRQDCSGYVCMALGIPPNASPGGWGGLNTVTLVTAGYIREIDPDDLKAGDLIGLCGPGTGGDDGHIQIFTRWYNTDPHDSRYWCLEQRGGTRGPVEALHNWPTNYKAYRYRDIADVQSTTGGTMAGEADAAFSRPYTGKETYISPASWMALAVERPLNSINEKMDKLADKVNKLAATPPGTVQVTDEQLERVLRRVLGSVDGASPAAG